MTERVARIPLVRRRRPKPPHWWASLALLVICVVEVINLARRAQEGMPYVLVAGSYACLASVSLKLMRTSDPEDDYSLFRLLVDLPALSIAAVACAVAGYVVAVLT